MQMDKIYSDEHNSSSTILRICVSGIDIGGRKFPHPTWNVHLMDHAWDGLLESRHTWVAKLSWFFLDHKHSGYSDRDWIRQGSYPKIEFLSRLFHWAGVSFHTIYVRQIPLRHFCRPRCWRIPWALYSGTGLLVSGPVLVSFSNCDMSAAGDVVFAAGQKFRYSMGSISVSLYLLPASSSSIQFLDNTPKTNSLKFALLRRIPLRRSSRIILRNLHIEHAVQSILYEFPEGLFLHGEASDHRHSSHKVYLGTSSEDLFR